MSAQNRVIHECSLAFPAPLPVEKLDELRRMFLVLMDEAAVAVQSAGLDLDDCVVRRLMKLRYCDDTFVLTIEPESLTEVDRLLGPFQRAWAKQFGTPQPRAPVEILEIAVQARRVVTP